jgi:hypothetical protein
VLCLATTSQVCNQFNKYALLSLKSLIGSAVYLYGASGPSYGKFEVTLDSKTSSHSAYATQNASNPHLLYSAENLPYDKHTLRVRNAGADGGGSDLLFDFIRAPFQLAPAGYVYFTRLVYQFLRKVVVLPWPIKQSKKMTLYCGIRENGGTTSQGTLVEGEALIQGQMEQVWSLISRVRLLCAT